MVRSFSIDWTPWKVLQPRFLILILQAVNFLPWKRILSHTIFKIITISRPSTLLRVLLILPTILPAIGIFSFTVMTSLKNFIGLKFFKTKWYPTGLSIRIIPPVTSVLSKRSPSLTLLSCYYQMLTSPTPFCKGLWENTRMGRESCPVVKICVFPAPENLPHLKTIFMHSPNTSFIYSLSHCCCIKSFYFRHFIHKYHLNFD